LAHGVLSAQIDKQIEVKRLGLERVTDRQDTFVCTLVGIAARMGDGKDESFVIALLLVNASGFLKQLEFHRRTINLTAARCSQDGATVAKSQEILRIYTDAASLVQSIIKKIDANPPQ
jgi:hypothetical protein